MQERIAAASLAHPEYRARVVEEALSGGPVERSITSFDQRPGPGHLRRAKGSDPLKVRLSLRAVQQAAKQHGDEQSCKGIVERQF